MLHYQPHLSLKNILINTARCCRLIALHNELFRGVAFHIDVSLPVDGKHRSLIHHILFLALNPIFSVIAYFCDLFSIGLLYRITTCNKMWTPLLARSRNMEASSNKRGTAGSKPQEAILPKPEDVSETLLSKFAENKTCHALRI